MNRYESTSSLRKSYSNEPTKTLSFIDVDHHHNNNDRDYEEHSHSDVTTRVDRNKSKTDKSVHFADEESIAEDDSSLNESLLSQTSRDGISWLPSEHLYSEDTFIHDETETVKTTTKETTTIQTVPSYGSNTFIESASDEDDTDTEQEYSYSDSFVSSQVFSSQSGTSGTATYKEWKDVTEIVKDIEELEESEFVTRADSLELGKHESEETEASETFDEEIAEAARQDFISYAIGRLRLKQLLSPRSLAVDSVTSSHSSVELRPSGPARSKEERAFCLKMIKKCKSQSEIKKSLATEPPCPHLLYAEVNRHKDLPLEYYGLNPALIERLKMENLQHSLIKKSEDLDKEIIKSKYFIENCPHDEAMAREKFISQTCAHVRRENMEDTIQAHLIKMHPITKFAEFVKDLPKADEDAREILYQYKRQLELRMEHDHDATDVT